MNWRDILFPIMLVVLLFNLVMGLVSWHQGEAIPHVSAALSDLTALALLMAWRAASRGL